MCSQTHPPRSHHWLPAPKTTLPGSWSLVSSGQGLSPHHPLSACAWQVPSLPFLLIHIPQLHPPALSQSVCPEVRAILPSTSPIFPASCVTSSGLPHPHCAWSPASREPSRGPSSPSPGHGRHTALPSMFSFLLSLLYCSVPFFCLLSVPRVSAGLKSGQEVWEGLAWVWGQAGQTGRSVFTEWPLVLGYCDDSSRILVVLQFSCLLVFVLCVNSCSLLLVEGDEERWVWMGASYGLWLLEVLSWRLKSTTHSGVLWKKVVHTKWAAFCLLRLRVQREQLELGREPVVLRWGCWTRREGSLGAKGSTAPWSGPRGGLARPSVDEPCLLLCLPLLLPREGGCGGAAGWWSCTHAGST